MRTILHRVLFLLTISIISTLCSFAQETKIVTGVVLDSKGNPLSNATVKAFGSSEQVVTEPNGTFCIEIPMWINQISASYVGKKDKKVLIVPSEPCVIELKKKRGYWFIDGVYTGNFKADKYYSRAGLIGGYLDEWGGYAKVLLSFGARGFVTPSVTAGCVKSIVKPLYFYIGAGYTTVFEDLDFVWYYPSRDDGVMFDAGFICKIGTLNINLGYSFCSNFSTIDNHSAQMGIGFCF